MTTIDLQIEAMAERWPGFKIIERGVSHVEWRGLLAPDKREHLVRVKHRIPMVLENISLHDAQPRVQVLKPLLERHPDYEEGPIPHAYVNKAEPTLPYLCLFSPTLREWDINDLIAHTTIHWAAQWLYFYEGWLVTKKWRGGGRHVNAQDEEKRLEPARSPI
ncbi:hypothetical protein FDV58_27805 [Bradyrhizobium elkanii]|uniref:Type II CBASS E2 protein domain-containing protein n=1 Tax=Bradyrhizobium elkanii TaxID=29448 RepID=A0A4U6RUT6_BRAEL|nr:hypothetical protein [Bradyrhizobium elkanii]TKV78008.1 hypothetical protein FDV58_27805 [Bradyrhizobium elkanii]